MFLVDLALRYFVSCLYNLDGFMEPLRTGLSEGLFVFWGVSGKTQGPSTSHQVRFRESDAALGMTGFRG
jgi:hypothetical protein